VLHLKLRFTVGDGRAFLYDGYANNNYAPRPPVTLTPILHKLGLTAPSTMHQWERLMVNGLVRLQVALELVD
jgi:hypothetical protein